MWCVIPLSEKFGEFPTSLTDHSPAPLFVTLHIVSNTVFCRAEQSYGFANQAKSSFKKFIHRLFLCLPWTWPGRGAPKAVSGEPTAPVRTTRRMRSRQSITSTINSPLTDTLVSGQLYLRTPFQIPVLPPSQSLYLHIPVSGHCLVSGRGHSWKWKLDFSFVYALS